LLFTYQIPNTDLYQSTILMHFPTDSILAHLGSSSAYSHGPVCHGRLRCLVHVLEGVKACRPQPLDDVLQGHHRLHAALGLGEGQEEKIHYCVWYTLLCCMHRMWKDGTISVESVDDDCNEVLLKKENIRTNWLKFNATCVFVWNVWSWDVAMITIPRGTCLAFNSVQIWKFAHTIWDQLFVNMIRFCSKSVCNEKPI